MFDTQVTVARTVLVELVALCLGLTWWGRRTHPGRGIWRDLLVGLTTLIILVPVDLGHALAHIFSARYAGAPMDEIRLSGGMPRTLYWNNDVSPNVHRIRALGGLVFSLVACLTSGMAYLAVPRRSVARELAAVSTGGHALLFSISLMPVPMVAGGTLIKWTLVAHGRTETQADSTATAVTARTRTAVAYRSDAATGQRPTIEVPDHAEAPLDPPDCAPGHMHVSAVAGLMPGPEIWLFGSEGTLRFEQQGERLSGVRKPATTLESIEIRPAERGGWRVEEEFITANDQCA